MTDYRDHLTMAAESLDRMAQEMELSLARMVYANEPHRIYLEGDHLMIERIKAEDFWTPPGDSPSERRR